MWLANTVVRFQQSQCTGTTATVITTIRLQQIHVGIPIEGLQFPLYDNTTPNKVNVQIQPAILFLQYYNTAVRFQHKALQCALYGNTTPDKVNALVLPPRRLRQYVYNKSSFIFSSYNTSIRQYGSNRKPCSLLYTAIQHPTKSMYRQYRHGDYDNTSTTNPVRYSVPTIRQYGTTVPIERPVVCSIRQYNI